MDIDQVFAWADRLSEHAQKLDRVRTLRKAITEGENTCGSCSHWMTDACPRERRDRFGTKVGGPSCKAIKCTEFAMKTSDAAWLEGLRKELAELSPRTQ